MPTTPPPTPTAGRGGPVVPICTPQRPLTTACAECSCSIRPECGRAISFCDAECWNAIYCVRDNCNTVPSAGCFERYCSAYRYAWDRASQAVSCLVSCSACMGDLYGTSPDFDAGLP